MNYFRPKKKKQNRDNKKERKEGRNVNESNRRNQVLLTIGTNRGGQELVRLIFCRTG
jgi:hypothetical protein